MFNALTFLTLDVMFVFFFNFLILSVKVGALMTDMKNEYKLGYKAGTQPI